MSRVLADLLGLSKEEVSGWLAQLEHKAGYPSEDVRLLADKAQKVRLKIASLGLDPSDTTGEELYGALLSKYDNDCALIGRALNISEGASRDEREDTAIRLLNHITGDSTVWVPKATALKTLLKKQPPRQLMRSWRYRSIESMVKREDPSEIVLAARMSESAAWRRNFNAKLGKLKESDYSLQSARILKLDGGRYPKHSKLKTVSNQKLGVVALYPGDDKNLQVLTIALVLLKELEKICLRLEVKPLAAVNPALGWWADTESLASWNSGKPVSMNIRDVAVAHAERSNYGEQSVKHAAESLMTDLADGYRRYIGDLPSELEAIGQKTGQEACKLVSPMGELALEAVEA